MRTYCEQGPSCFVERARKGRKVGVPPRCSFQDLMGSRKWTDVLPSRPSELYSTRVYICHEQLTDVRWRYCFPRWPLHVVREKSKKTSTYIAFIIIEASFLEESQPTDATSGFEPQFF
ncbi:hypothetical protein CEXT_684671 [Caerostris extrusa]|uniref:Uncharacterized protein n=1 Tax=Caerostris extrusa TaxID=172846 RepID=A0AAV4XJK8_CAEEX|nr:hypothetical protein CEXT_684671 [Caerostris extrusa]